MSGLVALHRDPIVQGAHVLALPPWLPPSPMGSYWHVPRSASVRADGLVTIVLWCGPFRQVAASELALAHEPPLEHRCGTCVGRRNGYDRDGGLIFQPRDHWQLPKLCPSTEPDPADFRLCAACGRPTNAARGWNGYGLARHAPDPALAERWEPCPRHGWRGMRYHDGQLRCWEWGCRP